ncbi:MAG: ATP-binding protein [Tissierella sp.]|uniref:sensor histidine kinase n=1 Tax=Tissierella sp. TaxID=41274 RepID=UPI003F9740AC
MTNKLKKDLEKVCIYIKNKTVYKVNNSFIELFGYSKDTIIGKNIKEIAILLKINYQIQFEDIKNKVNCYAFTKTDLPKDISITCEPIMDGNIIKYYFEESEDLALETLIDNFNNIDINDKEIIAIYSYPDCIHLKSSKNFTNMLNSMDIENKDYIGEFPKYPKPVSTLIKKGTSSLKREVELKNFNGKKSYWDISIRALSTKKDKKYLMCTFYDVTENVFERKLLEREGKEMEVILGNISDAIGKVNKKGEFTYLNKVAIERLTPYTSDPKSLDDKERFNLFKYNDIDGNELSFGETPIQRVLHGETIRNEVIIITSHLPAVYFECNGVPIYDKDGNIDGGILIYKDVRDRFKAEEYDAVKVNIKDICLNYVSLSYDKFKINYINETGFNTIAKNREGIDSVGQLIGKNFFDFFNLKEEEKQELMQNIKKAMEKNIIYSYIQKINERVEVQYIKTIFQPIFDSKSNIKKVIGVGIDITDEELANEEMNQALKAQDEMFINVSHELKTPLNLIFSASQLLEMYLKKDSLVDVKKDIIYSNEIIMQNCYRLTKLISNILDISKIESGFYKLNLTNNNIVNVIDDMVDSVSDYIKASGLELVFNTEIEEMIVAFDVYKIERLLLNLISNAIKFSSEKGTILIGLESKDNYVEITVEDNGIGIDRASMNIIFEKFRQLNKSLNRMSEGSGIGLSLVKAITQLHEGEISVESTLGKGSIFRVKLPIRTTNSENIESKESYYRNKTEMIKYELSDIYQ